MKNRFGWLLGFCVLSLVLYSCPPDTEYYCFKQEDCVKGALCNLETNKCIKCPGCKVCTEASQCDDNNVCTDDVCPKSGICENEFSTNSCDDGLFCNGEEVCNGEGQCIEQAEPCGSLTCDEEKDGCICVQHSECMQDYLCDLEQQICVHCPGCKVCENQAACNDDNVCTNESCPPSGICSYEYNTNSCDDGLYCNGQAVCDGQGNCAEQQPVCGEWPCDELNDTCTDLVWESIVTGHMHSCGLTTQGKIFCWGYDEIGQLGDGPGNSGSVKPVPIDTSNITGQKTFIQVTTKWKHTCGITSDGVAYCWGSDSNGPLGNGSNQGSSQKPVAVNTTNISGQKTFMQLSAGAYHTCGITSDGVAYCWGDDFQGQLGDVGYGQDSQYPVAVNTASITGNKTFSQISSGFFHTCGISSDGVAYCWGNNDAGQLGNTDAGEKSDVPVAVDTTPITGQKLFKHIAAGDPFTCGITTDNVAYCWGSDWSGCLGNGTVNGDSPVPVAVDTTPISGQTDFIYITAGGGHACGITIDKAVYCWGRNQESQLGTGDSIWSQSPVAADMFAITGSQLFLHLSAGSEHTCGVTIQGVGYCWGADSENQLGDGGISNYSLVPSEVDTTTISGLKTFNQISSGAVHSCGITNDDLVYCWGSDSDGRLGIGVGSNDTSQSPLAIDTSNISGAKQFEQISVGSYHSCGITTEYKGYCWGYNGYGQIGDGSTAPAEIPIAIGGGYLFKQISASELHTCGITTQNIAYCWGSDSYGQLGNGGEITSGDYSSVPVAVDTTSIDGEKTFASISAGYRHSCGITTEGIPYCWGSDSSGQLGNSNASGDNSSVPVAVDTTSIDGEKTFLLITAGGFHACGITTEGKPYCWGSLIDDVYFAPGAVDTTSIDGQKSFKYLQPGFNYTCGITTEDIPYCWGSDTKGQLGNGLGIENTDLPVKVDTSTITGSQLFSTLSAGKEHTCGITNDGVAYCWGSDKWGVLGNGGQPDIAMIPTAVDASFSGN